LESFNGKVALVTGAARGQGAVEARMISAQGGKVVIADVLDDLGEALAHELGHDVRYVHLDVRDEASWVSAIEFVLNEFNRLDYLVNNAGVNDTGVGATRLIENVTVEELNRIYAINQRGVALGIKHAVPAMKLQGGGAVVNIGSQASVRPMLGRTAYGGSKAAVYMITQVAALELAPQRIRVNAVLPGIINTAMVANAAPEAVRAAIAATPLGRMGEPVDVANAVLFLLSDQASFITGTSILVDGGGALT
jgi:3alpha(or 20beta)-hydroxysteroid dehydrogenase